MKIRKRNLNEALESQSAYMMDRRGNLYDMADTLSHIHQYLAQYYYDFDAMMASENGFYKGINNSFRQYIVSGLKFLYDNTPVKEDVMKVVNGLMASSQVSTYTKEAYEDAFPNASPAEIPFETMAELYKSLYEYMNEHFVRVRTNDKYWGGGASTIWFRISSNGFNWFNKIWQLAYDNRNHYKTINICRDHQSDKNDESYFYIIDGEEVEDMPIEDFINASGNPVIESFDDEI